jgi:hypothetical protein
MNLYYFVNLQLCNSMSSVQSLLVVGVPWLSYNWTLVSEECRQTKILEMEAEARPNPIGMEIFEMFNWEQNQGPNSRIRSTHAECLTRLTRREHNCPW